MPPTTAYNSIGLHAVFLYLGILDSDALVVIKRPVIEYLAVVRIEVLVREIVEFSVFCFDSHLALGSVYYFAGNA